MRPAGSALVDGAPEQLRAEAERVAALVGRIAADRRSPPLARRPQRGAGADDYGETRQVSNDDAGCTTTSP